MSINFLRNRAPSIKTAIAVFYDLLCLSIAFYLSLAIRHDSILIEQIPRHILLKYFVIVFVIQALTFKFNGLYKGIWRFSSTPDLIRVIKASLLGSAFSMIALFLFDRLTFMPRSFFIIDFVLLVISLGGGRFIYRIWADNFNLKKMQSHCENTIIVGAGEAGDQIFREIRRNHELSLNVVGFLDDNRDLKGRSLHNIPIVGTLTDIKPICDNYKITKVIIAIPTISSSQIRKIFDDLRELNLEIKVLPKINDLLNGEVHLSQLRNINVEDLLGRESVTLDSNLISNMILDKTIMVTGAGGSIGLELCKQILNFKPQNLILYELSEFNLYNAINELTPLSQDLKIIPIIGDVRNKEKVDEVVKAYRPNSIFHAAAYKHVPIMENDPFEAIQTNVVGTKIVSDVAISNGVSKFVLVSTDKAVNPTNIMGASKRIAELVCQNAQTLADNTDFSIVRFGNVLGSSGSVIPLFKKQIENGGPVTVTHKDIKRYFMSIPEACQLILQSGSLTSKGEIHVLDMGEPIKILDLAVQMIRLTGKRPYDDIKINFTGLRPGEKLFEELIIDTESMTSTIHPKVKTLKTSFSKEVFNEGLSGLLSLNLRSEVSQFKAIIKSLVPEYKTPEEHYLEYSNQASELQ